MILNTEFEIVQLEMFEIKKKGFYFEILNEGVYV